MSYAHPETLVDTAWVEAHLSDPSYCHVDNVSPGATVARSSGSTADEARGKAVTHARERLAKTVRR